MDKQLQEGSKFVSRHLSQLKVLSRLFEHELDLAKGDSVTLDRDMAESMLDTLEIFVEDVDLPRAASGSRSEGRERKGQQQEKPQVTRLN